VKIQFYRINGVVYLRLNFLFLLSVLCGLLGLQSKVALAQSSCGFTSAAQRCLNEAIAITDPANYLNCPNNKLQKVSKDLDPLIQAVEDSRNKFNNFMNKNKNTSTLQNPDIGQEALRLSSQKLDAELKLFSALNPGAEVKWPTDIRMKLVKFPELKSTIDSLKFKGDSVSLRNAQILESGDYKNPQFSNIAQQLGLYEKMKFEVFVKDSQGRFLKFKEMKTNGANGSFGPKIAEGDNQVPEGLFRLSNSHAYSSRFAATHVGFGYDSRTRDNTFSVPSFGGDIKIHGSGDSLTKGCVALSNPMAVDIAAMVQKNPGRSSLLVLPTNSKDIDAVTSKQRSSPNAKQWNDGLAEQANDLRKKRGLPPDSGSRGGTAPSLSSAANCSSSDSQFFDADPNPAANLNDHYAKLICANAPYETVTCDMEQSISSRRAMDCVVPNAIPIPEDLLCLTPENDPKLPGGKQGRRLDPGSGRATGSGARPQDGAPGTAGSNGQRPAGGAPSSLGNGSGSNGSGSGAGRGSQGGGSGSSGGSGGDPCKRYIANVRPQGNAYDANRAPLMLSGPSFVQTIFAESKAAADTAAEDLLRRRMRDKTMPLSSFSISVTKEVICPGDR
jgi:hypothetical protein